MTRKTAPTKAHEPKQDRCINQLLTDPVIHPDLLRLCDAMANVLVQSHRVAKTYNQLRDWAALYGLPTTDEWPNSRAIDRDKLQHDKAAKAMLDEYAKNGETPMVCDYLEPCWTGFMRKWSGHYVDWCGAIVTAKLAAQSPTVAAIMDTGELRPVHRWTAQTIRDLDNLAGLLHPIRMGGDDGLGFIRCELPEFPTQFPMSVQAVRKRLDDLRSIPASMVATPNGPALSTVVLSTVVLWEGAEQSDRNIKLAHTRTAYLENNGNVTAARKALAKKGKGIARGTFYNHLTALDKVARGWRDDRGQVSNQVGHLDGMHHVRKRGKS